MVERIDNKLGLAMGICVLQIVVALESATMKIAHIKTNIVLSVSCNLIRIIHADLVESMQIVFIVQLGVAFR